jgi:hypothetical protein
MERKMGILNKDFLQGFGIALADMNRMHDQPVHVRDTIEGAGFTLDDFKRAGLEDYDLDELRKAFD